MAIKQLALLSPTEIADGSFRSLTEVDKLIETVKENLNNLDALLRKYQQHFSKVNGFSAATASSIEFTIRRDGDTKPTKKKGSGVSISIEKPQVKNVDALRKNFSIVEELSENIEMLDSMYNAVVVKMKTMRGAGNMLKEIKALQKSAEAKMNAALKFLDTVGKKYVPEEFRNMVETTIGYVSPNLTFRKNETFIYAYETPEEHLAFSIYIKMYGLQDDEGNEHPQFFIVFTCVLRPTSLTSEDPKERKALKSKVDSFYYVTGMPNFQAPGKYILGKSISDPAKASAVLGLILDMENISTSIGVLPHNLGPGDLRKDKFSVGDMVDKIEAEPNALTFKLVKGYGDKEAQDAAKTLYREVKGMLSRIKNARLKARVQQTGGTYEIRFTLTNMAREDQISVNDIDFLKEHFPQLDDSKIRQVVKMINSD